MLQKQLIPETILLALIDLYKSPDLIDISILSHLDHFSHSNTLHNCVCMHTFYHPYIFVSLLKTKDEPLARQTETQHDKGKSKK